jgi:choline kinase
MKAVILAAGMGTRLRPMTLNMPKCMIDLHGKPLIEYSLDALVSNNFKEVIFVLGYLGETIRSHYGQQYQGMRLSYLSNPDFGTTGSMYSLSQTKGHIDEDILLLESDLLYDPAAIKTLLSRPEKDLISTAKISGSNDEVFICVDKDWNLKDLGKKIADKDKAIGELIGLTKLSKGYLEKLYNFADNEYKMGVLNDHYEECIFKLSKSVPIKCTLISNLVWTEIDNMNDYNRALSKIFPKIYKRA